MLCLALFFLLYYPTFQGRQGNLRLSDEDFDEIIKRFQMRFEKPDDSPRSFKYTYDLVMKSVYSTPRDNNVIFLLPAQSFKSTKATKKKAPLKKVELREESSAIPDGPNKKISQFTFQFINEFRSSKGRKALKWSEELYQKTLEHTKYQVSRHQISHDNFSKRLSKFHHKNENVAYFMNYKVTEPKAAKQFFTQWENSAGHRANMLATDVLNLAVGVIKTGNYYYATMIATD